MGLLWKQNRGLERMSISGRSSGAARSINVASRQRGLSGLDRDQNGFTSSSTCNTIRPQGDLRNLNLPVKPIALSCRMLHAPVTGHYGAPSTGVPAQLA